jgi:hypothetical protein
VVLLQHQLGTAAICTAAGAAPSIHHCQPSPPALQEGPADQLSCLVAPALTADDHAGTGDARLCGCHAMWI